MVRELLPDVQRTVFRPSIVLGDSRRPETTQFDMVRAFVFLAGLPVLPFRAERPRSTSCPWTTWPTRWCTCTRSRIPSTRSITSLPGPARKHFANSPTRWRKRAERCRRCSGPDWKGRFGSVVDWLSRRRDNVGYGASLLKVFLPYLVWNTVFDNTRVVAELGRAPAPFSSYCFPLLRFRAREPLPLSVSRLAGAAQPRARRLRRAERCRSTSRREAPRR